MHCQPGSSDVFFHVRHIQTAVLTGSLRSSGYAVTSATRMFTGLSQAEEQFRSMSNPQSRSVRLLLLPRDLKKVLERTRHRQKVPGCSFCPVTEFIILGLAKTPELRRLLFLIFLLVYLVAFLGNMLIVVAIACNTTLHTPMYVLLLALAIVDIICTTSIMPKMLGTMLASGKTISYGGCMSQLFFFTWSLGAEMVLFTAMAYDRYVAICFPLRYSTIMSHCTCVTLLGTVMAIAIINSGVNTGLTLRLTFCGPNTIDHFFCEIPPLLALSCSPVRVNEVMVYVADITLAVGDFALTCISYGFIVAALLRLRTVPCSSHLTVVCLYYSPVIYTYIRPASSYSFDRDKVVAALYTLVTPTLNPVVYSFRNKEMQAGIRKVFASLKHNGLERSCKNFLPPGARQLLCPAS
ncbi:olfactory receptor 13G1 [Tupaia chinensis]|uniref:olfactory receptor 13G1 n=1 Tax=Tupaia chinensis TaxID=246437 RepID=UPI0007041F09|nr:olfactory receptor 13G1 [Tupaia chinensis]